MPFTRVDLSILIVNWNTRDLLANCLESVIGNPLSVIGDQSPTSDHRSPITDYRSPATETIVVDNASSDGSAAMVRERFPWVTLIESRDNLGFAAGNNLALSATKGEYVLLLNPDTVVTEGAIARLWHVLTTRSMAGIAGAQLLNADDSLQMSIGVFPSLWSELPLLNRLQRPVHSSFGIDAPSGSLTVQRVDWVSGASLMIKQEVIEAIGPLDESFWLYTEETDWCYRARAAGWDVVFVPDARIYHLARAASRQRFVVTMLHFYQSRVRFVCKHHGPGQGVLAKRVYWSKAKRWQARPERSPLAQAYADLTAPEIRNAYQQLQQAMALPLEQLLLSNWQ